MSKRWLHEHHSDQYVKRARSEGYASRAAYKLIELNERDQFIRRGMTVVDLGAAPGGWSQVASEIVGPKGRVVALDRLDMTPVSSVDFIQGDFTEQAALDELMSVLDGTPVDVVISDMAPNISGNKAVDQPRAVYLVELAINCAYDILKPGGVFLTKIFQGADVDILIKDLRKQFKQVKTRKPASSRSRSSEIFIFASGFESKS